MRIGTKILHLARSHSRKPEPGGWNRVIINVEDLSAEIDRLRGDIVLSIKWNIRR